MEAHAPLCHFHLSTNLESGLVGSIDESYFGFHTMLQKSASQGGSERIGVLALVVVYHCGELQTIVHMLQLSVDGVDDEGTMFELSHSKRTIQPFACIGIEMDFEGGDLVLQIAQEVADDVIVRSHHVEGHIGQVLSQSDLIDMLMLQLSLRYLRQLSSLFAYLL